MGDNAEQLSDVSETGSTTEAQAEKPVETSTPEGAIKALVAERTKRQALEAELAKLRAEHESGAVERDTLSREATEAAERAARYQNHLTERAAERMATLTDAERKIVEASGVTDPIATDTIVSSIIAARSTRAAGFPAGVQGGQTAAPLELTPEEREWVQRERPSMVNASPATIREVFKKHGPGRKTSGQ